MPFVYDDIPDSEKDDPYVQAIAQTEHPLEVEELTKNSEYLIIEELHPLLFPVELDDVSVLPPWTNTPLGVLTKPLSMC